MSSECGIAVFADDVLPSSSPEPVADIEIELPSTMEYGKPCSAHGHADAQGRGLVGAKDGRCIVCRRTAVARNEGREVPASVDEIVAVELARARRKIEDELRKEARAREREQARERRERDAQVQKVRTARTLASPNRGKSGTPSAAIRDTGIKCARRGCRTTLSRIAAGVYGDGYCSRACAFPELKSKPKRYHSASGLAFGGADVSDDALVEIEA